MQQEIEIRVLGVNIPEITKKLESLDGKFVNSGLQRRYVYDVEPGNQNKWARIRTNGSKTTMGVKEVFDATTADGIHEVEVEINDFEQGNKLFESLGMNARSYQENRRTTYMLNDVEVVIDEWPKLQPYIEIEGPSKKAVYDTAHQLGFTNEDITVKHPTEMYREIGIDINTTPELKFEQTQA
jgi:adenylate cyclase class 2